MNALGIGIIGCGNISPLYLKTIRHFNNLQVKALSDIQMDVARSRASEFGVERVLSPDALLADPEIELVLNLTVPEVHATIARAALQAGKHVYNEKPLATQLSDAKELLALANQHNLRLGCAPSTFLGATVQTAKAAIDTGLIGEPVAASAMMMSRGMEHWHPNPGFFYQPGAGPMFDIGPYYLTALINLLGAAKVVTASARISFAERTITSQPLAGQTFKVMTPTHISGQIAHEAGPISTVVTSFDIWHTESPKLEIYGAEGTLSLEAPNVFGGRVKVRRAQDSDWHELPLVHSYTEMETGWGLGVADMALAIRENRPHRASGEQALHVLELMQAFLTSADSGQRVCIESSYNPPEAFKQAGM
jgi:predicted dehydrogenase